ncbi:energy transducer TonB [Hyphobacterium indicum]|uniref:energy transducer TonB n=1 Tax=Hyphobacterium indicum TaxID=2162714 RepID=UPI000D642263|nr:energy transducer TonB [Hyphobacterium indicum]
MHILTGILTSLILTFAAVAQGLPQDVADAYRAYEAAVDAENWAEATAQAETAWRAAEAGDVDAATTTILAANYGEVSLISGDNAGAAEAYERAAEIMGRRHEDVETRANYLRMAAQAYYVAQDFARARRLSENATNGYERLPQSETRAAGLYQSNLLSAFSVMNEGDSIRAGRYAREAMEALSEIGPVANNDTASLTFLAGLAETFRNNAEEAGYYFSLSGYINEAIGSEGRTAEIANAWASYARGNIPARNRPELIRRLRDSGYEPAGCGTALLSCSAEADEQELVSRFGPDAVIVPSAPLHREPPRYPEEAAMVGLEGIALVMFDVEADGSVSNGEVLYTVPHPIFGEAALEALERWEYSPMTVDGVAVRREGVVTQFGFEMSN